MQQTSFARASALAALITATVFGCATAGDANDGTGGGVDSGSQRDAAGTGNDGSHADAGATDSGASDAGVQDGSPSDGGNMMDVAAACVPVLVADAGNDAAINDGGDAGDAATDAAVDSGGGVCAPPSPGQCGPADVTTTFQPTWHPPTGAHQGLCSQAQINTYYADCLGPTSDPFTCDTFTTSNTACVTCLSTDDTASSYGPLINRTVVGIVSINVGGCIALLEPCNLECAQAYMANDECTVASCGDNCPVVDDISFQDYLACTTTSETCSCASENTRAACANLLTGATHPAEACVTAPDFQTFFQTVAPIFCGQ